MKMLAMLNSLEHLINKLFNPQCHQVLLKSHLALNNQLKQLYFQTKGYT
jgi:hypothetical protein